MKVCHAKVFFNSLRQVLQTSNYSIIIRQGQQRFWPFISKNIFNSNLFIPLLIIFPQNVHFNKVKRLSNTNKLITEKQLKGENFYLTSTLGLRLLGSVSEVTVVLGRLEISQVFTGCIGSDCFEWSTHFGLSSKVTS